MNDRSAPARRALLPGGRGIVLGRRGLLATLAGLGLLACGRAPSHRVGGPSTDGAPPRPAAPARDGRLEALERRLGGRLGVAAIDGASGVLLAGHRADERFAMCSTFKAPLAAAVLARVDRGALALDAPLAFGEADLLDHAPVARERLARRAMSVEDACAAAVEVSDNTAANLLLARIGGPAGLTAFVRALGDDVTRLDRDEPSLNTNLPGDPRDTTSPRAMARTMAALVLGEQALSRASRERLARWMIASATGRARLRAGLPAGWIAGDKTGTGANGAANDVAVAWPPGRAPLVIACYVDSPGAAPGERDAAHAEVARLVTATLPDGGAR